MRTVSDLGQFFIYQGFNATPGGCTRRAARQHRRVSGDRAASRSPHHRPFKDRDRNGTQDIHGLLLQHGPIVRKEATASSASADEQSRESADPVVLVTHESPRPEAAS